MHFLIPIPILFKLPIVSSVRILLKIVLSKIHFPAIRKVNFVATNHLKNFVLFIHVTKLVHQCLQWAQQSTPLS